MHLCRNTVQRYIQDIFKIEQWILMKWNIDIVSDLTWQLIFNQLQVVEFLCRIEEEYPQLKAIKILFPFQLHSHVRPDFLHVLQPKQHINTD